MKKRSALTLGLLATISVFAWMAFSPNNGQVGHGNAPELFVTVENVVSPAQLPVDSAKADKLVRIAPNAREEIMRVGGTFIFRTPQGESLTVTIQRLEQMGDGGWVSYGAVAGDEDSVATFSVAGEAVAGTVELSDERTFDLNFAGNSIHQVAELDYNQIDRDCGTCSDRPKVPVGSLPPGVVFEEDAAINTGADSNQEKHLPRD